MKKMILIGFILFIGTFLSANLIPPKTQEEIYKESIQMLQKVDNKKDFNIATNKLESLSKNGYSNASLALSKISLLLYNNTKDKKYLKMFSQYLILSTNQKKQENK